MPLVRGKLAFLLLLISSFSASTLRAQDVVGQWQGTVQTSHPLRVVLKVAKTAGQLRAYLISIDQSPEYIPVTNFSASQGEVKFSVAMVQGTYQGKVSADGTEINGSWTQGAALTLDLHRTAPESSWLAKSTIRSIKVAPDVSLEVIDWGGSGPATCVSIGIGKHCPHFRQLCAKVCSRISRLWDHRTFTMYMRPSTPASRGLWFCSFGRGREMSLSKHARSSAGSVRVEDAQQSSREYTGNRMNL